MFIDAGIGHVLIPPAHGKTFREVPVQTDVVGKLKPAAQISFTKIILAQKCRAYTAFERHREFPLTQFNDRPNCADKAVLPAATEPARRSFDPQLKAQAKIRIPLPWQIPARKDVGLPEITCVAFKRGPTAHACEVILRFHMACD